MSYGHGKIILSTTYGIYNFGNNKKTPTHTHKIYDQTNYTTISRYPKKKCQIILQHFTFIYL